MKDSINFITLTALAESIRETLERHLPGEEWVVAEVSEVKVNQLGHCYLELIEKPAGGRMPSAVARGVIWNRSYKMISGYFRFQTGRDIAAGMKILVKCSVNYHPVYGLSLVITDIDPAYTLGEAERLRRETIERLRQEGVFDMNRELELPPVVQRIAVVSSANAAGYQDFMKEIESSPYRFEAVLFRAVMQGAEAESSVIAALEAIALSDEDFDAVAIIRGGGSQSDLACFDGYLISSNIAQFPLPVLTGIGHDKDISVADMVANMSMKTPTAVAASLVEMASEFAGMLQAFGNEVAALAGDILSSERQQIENCALMLGQCTLETIHGQRIYITETASRLNISVRDVINGQSNRLGNLRTDLSQASRQTVGNGMSALNVFAEKLSAAAAGVVAGQRALLDLRAARIEGADPRRILKRGYAIVRREGKALKKASEAAVGEMLAVELHGGRLTAEVKSKTRK